MAVFAAVAGIGAADLFKLRRDIVAPPYGTADALPPLCRPSGWAALWRRMGASSILCRRTAFSL
ncbi:hypothetical protein Q9295_11510 [Xinfangfangia sp. CPCC 101601]|uniref:Uncharacterized protein n=1 Tax=Pseudogemmobacter lacusdianii TaxID=3069608 RepID=A0ABU0W1R2_9RHOB|nr:hypothetical protein [Xinfangfangia sp. CPCC 101601]MDQ2067005.1 hypothetical protein [Xinfangfangia sp. CPCC 101601]